MRAIGVPAFSSIGIKVDRGSFTIFAESWKKVEACSSKEDQPQGCELVDSADLVCGYFVRIGKAVAVTGPSMVWPRSI